MMEFSGAIMKKISNVVFRETVVINGDAGMRQLNETGYMHNRVRMVVASFSVNI
jgi:hypothetical protein